jgi:hypothetical protein
MAEAGSGQTLSAVKKELLQRHAPTRPHLGLVVFSCFPDKESSMTC